MIPGLLDQEFGPVCQGFGPVCRRIKKVPSVIICNLMYSLEVKNLISKNKYLFDYDVQNKIVI